MAADVFVRIARDLAGMTLGHLWRGHGSALFLEFGALSERRRADGSAGQPVGEISVGLEFDWRIEADGRVLCASGGDAERWPEAFAGLIGRRAASIALFGDPPELRLELAGGARLVSFSLDDDGPQWALTDHRGASPAWVYWRDGALRCDDGAVAG